MIVSNFSKSLFCFLCVHDCGETAPFFLEDFSRHELRTFFRNDRLEFHVRENILLNVNTRSYLDQLETFCAGLKDASFRNIQSRLTVLDCLRSVISDLLGLLYELLELTFLIDDELPSSMCSFRPLAVNVPMKHAFFAPAVMFVNPPTPRVTPFSLDTLIEPSS